MTRKLFVVDDDLIFAKLLAANLRNERALSIELFSDAASMLERRTHEPPDAVITDLMMPDIDGIELTRQLRGTDPHLPIFVLTASTEIASAIAALKAGATDYLTKPVNVDELLTQLRRAIDERPMREEAATLERTRKQKFSAGAILGDEPAIEGVREFVRRVAGISNSTVLLLGESGTGKNLVARTLHYTSAQAKARFVEINCSALPAHLLEAELFGALQKKDVPGLEQLTKKISPAHRRALMLLPGLYGGPEVLGVAEKKLPKIAALTRALATLRKLARACKLPVSLDLAELRGYHYHSGVVLDAYCDGVAGAVARGGRYDEVGKAFGQARPATGFSIYLRGLAGAVR